MAFFNAGNQDDVSEEALKERSYLWMARVFCLICVVTLIADLILFSALDSLLPLVRVQPFYIKTQDKDQQVIEIIRPSTKLLNSEMLQRAFVRQYLVARLGIGSDTDELERRWGPDGAIQWMSETSVFGTFLQEEAQKAVQQAKEIGLTRRVDIRNLRREPRQNQVVWKAEVQLSDMSRSSPDQKVTMWEITLVIEFGKLRDGMTWDQRLKNPLGFRVVGYGAVPMGKGS